MFKPYLAIQITPSVFSSCLILHPFGITHSQTTSSATSPLTANAIISTLRKIIKSYTNHHLGGVIIGLPATVNTATGTIICHGNELAHCQDLNLKEQLAKDFSFPIIIDNLVNFIGLGAANSLGEALNPLYYFHLDNHLGGCIINNGQLFYGANFATGNLGLMGIGDGNLGLLLSPQHLLETIAHKKNLPPHSMVDVDLFTMAKLQGDSDTIATIIGFVNNIADTLVNIISLINPPLIMLGGDIIINKAPYLQPLIQESFKQRIKGFVAPQLKFVKNHHNLANLGMYAYLTKDF